MTKIKKGSAIAALCSLVAIGGSFVTINQMSVSFPENIETYEAIEQEKDYTVMVYMIGSDLESDTDDVVGAGSKDLEEMIEVMTGEQSEVINKKTNLVVEVGGSYRWEEKALADIQNARFSIDENGISELSKISDTNMGESAALSDFINYASGTYPAKNYILLFWNHGNGPVDGYGYDVLHNGDSVMLSEIKEGIEKSELAEKRIQLVGFDACLMGSLEVAGIMSNYADYMVASAELEPEDGWDYQWLEVFAQEQLDGEMIGRKVIDSYFEFYKEKDYQVTLSCLDLSVYGQVMEDFSAYLQHLHKKQNKELYEIISQNRKQIQGFGSSIAATDSCDLVDVEQFVKTLSEEAWQETGLEASIKNFIPIKEEKGYTQELCGISIYLPSGSDMMLEESIEKYKSTGFATEYVSLVSDYSNYLLNGEEVNLEYAMESYENQEGHLFAQLSTDILSEISAVYLVTAKLLPELTECSYVLSTDSDLTINDLGEIDVIPDGEYVAIKGQVLCFIEQYNRKEQTDYLSPVLYNGELCMMKIRFSDDNPDGEIVTIIPVSSEKTSLKKVYELNIGDSLIPLYPLLTDDNTPLEQLQGRDDIYEGLYYMGTKVEMEEEWDMMLETVNVNLSECVFGFMIQDNRQQFQYTELLQL